MNLLDLGLNPLTILSTLLYSFMGIVMLVIGYVLVDKIAPFSLTKELIEDHNVAIGIIIAGTMIGISIIIAASILS